MKYRVIHPFLDKYHPEDIFYPDDIVSVEDPERLNDLMELELLAPCKDNVSPYKILKDKIVKDITEEEMPESGAEDEQVSGNDLTVAEVKAKLDEKGIKYDKRLNKDKLMKLLEEAE